MIRRAIALGGLNAAARGTSILRSAKVSTLSTVWIWVFLREIKIKGEGIPAVNNSSAAQRR